MDWLLTETGRQMWQYFYNLCFVIDGTISKLNYGIFDVFSTLAQTRIFSSDIISDLTKRSYSIISVTMLFVLAYSLLKMIVNPDEAKKGKTSGLSIAKHMIVALVVIVFTPSVFDFSYGMQNSIIKNNVIGKAIVGSNEDITSNAAGEFVTSVFSASFYLNENPIEDVEELYYEDMTIAKTTGDIKIFRNMTDYIIADQVEYHNIISLIVSGVVLYVLVTFCFDMGVRVIKLAFLQLIAPIPAVLYVLPGKEESLKKWIKESFSCFFEVVVRSAVLYFTIFLFLILNRKMDTFLINYTPLTASAESPTYNATVYYITKYFIIFSLLVFMKQAPKLIGDLFGIKSDGKLLSLKDRLKDYKPIARGVVRAGDKVIGAGAAIPVAMKAYKKGVQNGNKDTKFRKFMAGLNGLSNGFRGGISNIGNVYDYEYETQGTYSRMPQDGSDFSSVARATFEHEMTKFGFERPYTYLKRDEQMKTNIEVTPYRNEVQDYNSQVRKADTSLSNTYDNIKSDNEDMEKLDSSLKSSVESNVSKGSSTINSSLEIQSYRDDLLAKLQKSNNKINETDSNGNKILKGTDLSEEEAKRDRLTLQLENLDKCLLGAVSFDAQSSLSLKTSYMDFLSNQISSLENIQNDNTLNADVRTHARDTIDEFRTKLNSINSMSNDDLFSKASAIYNDYNNDFLRFNRWFAQADDNVKAGIPFDANKYSSELESFNKVNLITKLGSDSNFTGNYNELTQFEQRISYDNTLSATEKQVLSDIINVRKKEIVNTAKAQVIDDVLHGRDNKDSDSVAIAKEFIQSLLSSNRQIGIEAGSLSDKEHAKMETAGLTVEEINAIQSRFSRNDDVENLKNAIKNGDEINVELIKDFNDGLKECISKAKVKKSDEMSKVELVKHGSESIIAKINDDAKLKVEQWRAEARTMIDSNSQEVVEIRTMYPNINDTDLIEKLVEDKRNIYIRDERKNKGVSINLIDVNDIIKKDNKIINDAMERQKNIMEALKDREELDKSWDDLRKISSRKHNAKSNKN